MPTSSRRTSRTVLAAVALLAAAPGARAEEALSIVSRTEWGAKPASSSMRANNPQRITIHHSASKGKAGASLSGKLQGLQNFSQRAEKLADGRVKKPWADLPYHFYIDADGRVAEGRDVAFVGDTNTDYDPAGHIGVVLEGNFETETPSAAQVGALQTLLVHLARRYGIPAAAIGGHRAVARTACPGRNLDALLPQIRAAVARALSSG